MSRLLSQLRHFESSALTGRTLPAGKNPPPVGLAYLRSSRTLPSVRVRPNGLLLVPAAALVVHQARYTLAYGSHANAELAAQGHSYLNSVVPWTILALGLGASRFLQRAAGAARTGESGAFTRISAAALWAVTTAGLLAIYLVQETLESFSASGHPGGVPGLLGHGGWWAVPAAGVVALGVVALLRLGRAVLRLASRLAPGAARARGTCVLLPSSVALVAPTPLALAAAGRAPPLTRA
jgi:hypothetical protein